MARNLLNIKDLEKGYASHSVLHGITLGISANERIGLVGQNGGGKSTLLRLLAGLELPDAGDITRAGAVEVALVGQRDELDERQSVREALVGTRAEHEWAGDSAFRGVLDASRSRDYCSSHRSCCCSMSPRTTSTSKGSTGLRATSPRVAGRWSW